MSRPLAAALLLGALVLATACSGGGNDLGPAQFGSGISIEEALTREAGEMVTVNGWLADTPGNPSQAPELCTSLRRPQPFVFECVGPSMVVLLNMDRYPGIERVDGTTWVDEPVQITGTIVRPPGRDAEIDPFNCLEAFTERCRFPTWHQFPAAATPSPEATTERRALTPPAPTSTDVAMIPIPAPTTFRGFPADLLLITTFDNNRRPVTDQRDIEAAVPWPIVLPAYLPPGYDRIGLVQVFQPMPNLPPDVAARTTRVVVAFRGPQPGPNFSLILNGGHVGTDGAPTEVNGRPAEYGLNQARAQTLAWDVCGRTLMLAALESEVPKPELIRIAESVPEQCS
ncbi:MAG: hypothetical protein AB7L91_03415 [Dehalococcoidia bacterium]